MGCGRSFPRVLKCPSGQGAWWTSCSSLARQTRKPRFREGQCGFGCSGTGEGEGGGKSTLPAPPTAPGHVRPQAPPRLQGRDQQVVTSVHFSSGPTLTPSPCPVSHEPPLGSSPLTRFFHCCLSIVYADCLCSLLGSQIRTASLPPPAAISISGIWEGSGTSALVWKGPALSSRGLAEHAALT